MYKEILHVAFIVHIPATQLTLCNCKDNLKVLLSSFFRISHVYVPAATIGMLSVSSLRNYAVFALVTFLFQFGP